jgi:folate-binding protein YgfZ
MARKSPLMSMLAEAEASMAPYGPETNGEHVLLVESFGELELEYAAIRKSCALIDQPHRGTIEITGPDRLGFLNRMLTQELKGLGPFRVRRSFWLNRKGRIDADIRLIDLPHRTLLDVDVHAVQRTVNGLSGYVITEDVTIRDVTEEYHRLALHGPTSMTLLQMLSSPTSGADASGPPMQELPPDHVCVVQLCGHEAVIDRDDATGDEGYEILVKANVAADVYSTLLDQGTDPGAGAPEALRASLAPTLGTRVKLRPAGWHAYNIARIENGRALYYVDFGPDSLPAETGVFDDRVSLTKGCYLGQEIVARMHSRGHPKQQLVAIRFQAAASASEGKLDVPQPVSGAHVFLAAAGAEAGKPEAAVDPIGVVTSSTVAPLLGSRPVAFAQVKFEHTRPGTGVIVHAEGTRLTGEVQPTLRFVKRR